MTQNVDLRIRRTRKLLRDALVELIDEKGFDALTVQDIAERAMINRATFYRHFTDKYELLEHSMDDVWEELAARLEPPLRDPLKIRPHKPGRNLLLFFEHVAENASFYRVMLGKWQIDSFVERLRVFFTELLLERLDAALPDHHKAPVPPPLVIGANVAMCIGMIRWWVENHLPCTSEAMAQYYVILTGFGIYRALGVEQPNWSGEAG